MKGQSSTNLIRRPLLRKRVGLLRGKSPKTVYVAMSGGVDSSVAAVLLKKQGFNVVGVFMKPWSPEATNSKSQISSSKQIPNSKFQILNSSLCLWQQDREDAMRVAAVLGIPLLTWDFSKEYKKEVGDYMIREYRAGRTPNPDVMCNKEIKFGLFLKRALEEGADYIATGHYVKKQKAKSKKQNHNSKSKIIYRLFQAKDKNKDQSYFLWTLSQEQLKYCLFPIGDYTKPEVRKLAKKFGLPNYDKKDSQGVCFIGPLDMKDFLKRYIKPKTGKILLLDDNNSSVNSGRTVHKTVSSHDGVYYYTIGQRHGLDIKNGQGPYYVISKDIKKNIIYVGKDKDLGTRETRISNIVWTGGKVKLPAEFDVKIRYRTKSENATLYKNGSLRFKKPIRAITSGQSAVLYKGQELVGGGIIV